MAKATRSTYRVAFRRRREGRTVYSKRIALLKFGDRLVVRKTSARIIVQLISYSPKGDRVIASANSKELESFGLPPSKNCVAAYLTGYALAKRALSKGIKKAILDLGRRTPVNSSFAFAALKGALDGGLDIPHGDGIFDEARFKGEYIAAYAKSLKSSDPNDYKKIFSQYLKKGIDPEKLPAIAEGVKEKL